MLRNRLAAGTVLAAAVGLTLAADARLGPYFPCLLLLTLTFAVLAAGEFVALTPAAVRPRQRLTAGGVALVLAANWVGPAADLDPWRPVFAAFAGFVGVAFVVELLTYSGPAGAVGRVAGAVLAVAYLGLLPGGLLRLRWAGPDAVAWLTAAVFVPKCGDIGAYFVGRAVGRRPFAPALSPKKTWEGFAGGLVASAGTAAGIHAATGLFRHGYVEAAGFGLVVGCAGVIGDLAESLLKREAGAKDAAATVPGFGGVLDVLDSVLFAGPVAGAWVAAGGYNSVV